MKASRRVFISNLQLDHAMTPNEAQKLICFIFWENFGMPESVLYLKTRKGERAFVTFSDQEAADKCVNAYKDILKEKELM